MPKIKWSWQQFLVDLGKTAPLIIAGSLALKGETGNVSWQQEAADALKVGTGVADGLTHDDPAVKEAAATASSIIDAIVAGSAKHG